MQNTCYNVGVDTDKICKIQGLFKDQGLLKDFPTVFKDRKLTQNTDLNVKNFLLKC